MTTSTLSTNNCGIHRHPGQILYEHVLIDSGTLDLPSPARSPPASWITPLSMAEGITHIRGAVSSNLPYWKLLETRSSHTDIPGVAYLIPNDEVKTASEAVSGCVC